jgi:hypothetical protein
MHRLRCSLRTSKPIGETFAVFENPRNLARITPPWLNFRITTAGSIDMRKDAIINYTIRWHGIPMGWRTRITGYEPPYRFSDLQERGPYASWHHLHAFEEDGAGTLVSDCVEYRLPLGPLGAIAHEAVVRRQLVGIFEYRQKALGELLGAVTVVDPPRIERV